MELPKSWGSALILREGR